MTTSTKSPQADDAVKAGKRASDINVEDLSSTKARAKAWDRELAKAKADLATIRGEAAAVAMDPLFTKSGADLLDTTYSATPYLVRRLFVDHGVQVISAEAKGTKTWITMELAFAVASATPMFDRFETCVPPSHVALFQPEDSERASRAKIRSIGRARGMSDEDIREVATRMHFHNLKRLDVLNNDHAALVIASVRRMRSAPVLLVLDPLVKLHHVKENDADQMELVTNAIEDIGRVLRLAPVLAHHNGKANESTGKRRGGQRMRGSGALHGAVNGGLYLDAPTGDRVSEWVVKAESEIKGALSADPFTLTLRILEDDEHGQAKRVSWTVTDEAKAAPADPLAAAAKLISDVFRLLSDTEPLKQADIERRLGLRNGGSSAPLRDLENEGRAKHIRKGWLRVPEIPGTRGDSGDSKTTPPTNPQTESPLKRGGFGGLVPGDSGDSGDSGIPDIGGPEDGEIARTFEADGGGAE
jgi:hypothetical protein